MGRAEVRKFQLHNSAGEKIWKDLRLSSYNSTDGIFRVFQNNYWNKPAIALERVREVERLPPFKWHHPRRAIEGFGTIEGPERPHATWEHGSHEELSDSWFL